MCECKWSFARDSFASFEPRSGYMSSKSAFLLVFTKSLLSLAVSLVTGRLTNSPTLLNIPAPFTESFDRLGRRMILLQRSQSVNRTRVTQSEVTVFRALYTLHQHSFPILHILIAVNCINLAETLQLFYGKLQLTKSTDPVCRKSDMHL